MNYSLADRRLSCDYSVSLSHLAEQAS